MSAGTWVLTYAVLMPGNTSSVECEEDGFGGSEPTWFLDEHTIGFLWSDGRRYIVPWAALADARFTPPAASVPLPADDGDAT